MSCEDRNDFCGESLRTSQILRHPSDRSLRRVSHLGPLCFDALCQLFARLCSLYWCMSEPFRRGWRLGDPVNQDLRVVRLLPMPPWRVQRETKVVGACVWSFERQTGRSAWPPAAERGLACAWSRPRIRSDEEARSRSEDPARRKEHPLRWRGPTETRHGAALGAVGAVCAPVKGAGGGSPPFA